MSHGGNQMNTAGPLIVLRIKCHCDWVGMNASHIKCTHITELLKAFIYNL